MPGDGFEVSRCRRSPKNVTLTCKAVGTRWPSWTAAFRGCLQVPPVHGAAWTAHPGTATRVERRAAQRFPSSLPPSSSAPSNHYCASTCALLFVSHPPSFSLSPAQSLSSISILTFRTAIIDLLALHLPFTPDLLHDATPARNPFLIEVDLRPLFSEHHSPSFAPGPPVNCLIIVKRLGCSNTLSQAH